MTGLAAPSRPRLGPGAGEPAPAATVGAVGLAAGLGVVAGVSPEVALVGVATLLVGVLVFARPIWATYLLLGIGPLVVGIDRGTVVPLLRINEALFVLLASAVLARRLWDVLGGRSVRLRPDAMDGVLLLLVVTSSVVPWLWLLARGEPVTGEVIRFSLTLLKYYGFFLLVRATVRSERDVRRCLAVILATTAVVAVVAVLQAVQLFGVPQLLATYYAPFGSEEDLLRNRGTSTLASSVALASLMTYGLAVALAWLLRGGRPRPALYGAGALLLLGALASGQFSAVPALVVGVLALGWVTGQLRGVLARIAPAAAAGALLLYPVIERRMSGFDTPSGLPPSWEGRIDNLREYFWPELFTEGNYLLGVTPIPRLAGHEWWQGWIWIESGHTWLLWSGGVPLLLAFFLFLGVSLSRVAATARSRSDPVGVAAAASFAALCVVAVLTTLDPHLTMRGSADLLFPLLALACIDRERRPPWPADSGPNGG